MIDVFVISPYTDDDLEVIAHRVKEAERYVASLVRQGVVVYSTIAAMDHIVKTYQLPSDYPFWQKHCEQMISCSSKVHILMLDGYDESTGVADELQIAVSMGKPITTIQCDDDGSFQQLL